MKKLFLVGALALFGAMNAQTFGVKAGYTLSSLKSTSSGTSQSGTKSSFYLGALGEYKVSDQLAINGEILYSPLGGKATVSESGSGYSYTEESDVKIGTLQIPVGLKYYATENFSVGAGMNFGIILSAKNDWKSSETVLGTTVTDSGSTDVKSQTNTLNLAPYIGAEYNLENGLFFDGRYNFGLSDLDKDGSVNTKMSFLQVGIGYKFGK